MIKIFMEFFLFVFITCLASPPRSNFNEDIRKFELIENKIDSIYYYQGTNAKILADELRIIAENHTQEEGLYIQYLYYQSKINHVQRISDSILVKKIQEILQSKSGRIQNNNDMKLHYAYAMNCFIEGNYVQAFTTAMKILEYATHERYNDFKYKALLLAGDICKDINNLKMAENYFNQAKLFCHEATTDYYQVLIRLYKVRFPIYSTLTEDDLDSVNNLIQTFKEGKDVGLLAYAYLIKGTFYIFTNDTSGNVLNTYDNVHALLSQVDNREIHFSLYQNLGFYYTVAVKNFPKAQEFLSKAHTIALQNNNKRMLAHTLKNLSVLYKEMGKIDSALFYLDAYILVRDGIDHNAKIIEAYQTYMSDLLESSQHKLTIAEQKIMLKNRRFAIMIVIAISSVLLVVLLWIIFNQKRHQQTLAKEVENRDLALRLAHETEMQQLQAEQIEEKIRELTSYSLRLSSKNNILQQVIDIAKQPQPKKAALLEISRLIKEHMRTDDYWNTFISHFEKVHPNFFHKLKTVNSGFTENDLRIAAYIRMGMSSKQIAQVMSITSLAVKMTRYRIKKKISVAMGDDVQLNDFLRTLA